MRILVTGGRNYTDRERLYEVLDAIHAETPVTLLIEGGADGADRLGCRWAIDHQVAIHTEPAQWGDMTVQPCAPKRRWDGTVYNAAAGSIRNQKMVDMNPDLVVAFPGGSGTADCVQRAAAAGIKVFRV